MRGRPDAMMLEMLGSIAPVVRPALIAAAACALGAAGCGTGMSTEITDVATENADVRVTAGWLDGAVVQHVIARTEVRFDGAAVLIDNPSVVLEFEDGNRRLIDPHLDILGDTRNVFDLEVRRPAEGNARHQAAGATGSELFAWWVMEGFIEKVPAILSENLASSPAGLRESARALAQRLLAEDQTRFTGRFGPAPFAGSFRLTDAGKRKLRSAIDLATTQTSSR